MKSYVFVTFAFLAAAFYHLSGGAGYQPQPGSLQAERARQAIAPDARMVADTGGARAAASARSSLSSPAQPDRQTAAVKPATIPGFDRPTALPAIVSRTAFAPDLPGAENTADPRAMDRYSLAALATARPADSPSDSPAERAAPAKDLPAQDLPAKDLRSVRKSRVNLRLGPGTQYNVVAKLAAGTPVELLQDPGNGWVKLRVVDGGRVGWMAQSMISGPN